MRLKIQSEEARSRLQTLEGIWAKASSHTQEITKGAKQATTCLVHAATELVHAKERDQGLTWTDVFDKCLQMETQVFRTIYFHNRAHQEKKDGKGGDEEKETKDDFNGKIKGDFFNLSKIIRTHIMDEPTEYDLEGGKSIGASFRTFWKVMTLDPVTMATDEQQLECKCDYSLCL